MVVPIVPRTKEDIAKLANTLLVGSLFRPEIWEKIKDPHDRVTWVDSLAVAAWALAYEKAGYSISEIAEKIGRTEQTIRKHLKGETEAGKIVLETYEKLKKGEDVLTFDVITRANKIKEIKEDILNKIQNLEAEIEKLKQSLDAIKKELEEIK